MIKNLLCTCLTFFVFFGSAQNFVASYSFANVTTSSGSVDPGTPPIANGLTFGSFFYSGPALNPSASGRFSFTGWPVGAVDGDDNYLNYTAALSPTVYYEVTLRVAPAHTLNLNSIAFAVRRSGTGIRNYVVRSGRDNFNNNLAASTGTNSKLSIIPNNVFFWNYDSISTASDQRGNLVTLNTNFYGITDSVTFRFYAWNAESNGGTFSIDNVSFSGTVTDSNAVLNPVGVIRNETALEKIRVYPNPCNRIKLKLEGVFENNIIELISASGFKFNCKQINVGSDQIEIDVSDLSPGIYFLGITSGRQRRSIKFIVSPYKD